MITPDEGETVLALYQTFKEEVYQRRNQMMRWTAIGAGSLMTLLLIVLLVPSAHLLAFPARLLLASGSLLLALTFAMMVWQHHDRHRQAKQQLITLEQTLGLFEKQPWPDDRPMYPDNWQTDWTHDRSLMQYVAVLALLTVITLLAILLPSV